jgi:N-acetylmuramoyl-L-alanine amidase
MENKLIVHCSDSTFGNTLTIEQWHKERGFDTVGYHWVILNGRATKRSPYRAFLDGTIESGRSELKRGAHCTGHNGYYGVCLIGKTEFTPFQFKSLALIVNELAIPIKHIYPHNAFSTKTCPNFDVEKWKEDYLNA